MRMHRNLYTPEELDFILKEARRKSPDEIQRASGDVFRLHRAVRDANRWPRRSRASIENKLWNIQSGKQVVGVIRYKAGSANITPNTGRGRGQEVGIDGAYAAFRRRIEAAQEQFENEKKEAKVELQKVISTI